MYNSAESSREIHPHSFVKVSESQETKEFSTTASTTISSSLFQIYLEVSAGFYFSFCSLFSYVTPTAIKRASQRSPELNFITMGGFWEIIIKKWKHLSWDVTEVHPRIASLASTLDERRFHKMQLVCEIKLSVLRCRATIGTSQAGKVCLVQLLHENSLCRKPSAALPSHRMGGFNVSSWLQLLLCIIWPWVELIFLSFKTDDKLELWMLFRERASVPLNVRKGQRQQEYHFIHPAIAQAKNRASSVYKCQMWETHELCFYFLWLLSVKSQTDRLSHH